MNPPLIVPDASVLLKWSLYFSDEEDREKALVLRNLWLAGQVRIVLPSLWIYEVGNILGLKQPDRARRLLEIYIGYQFEEERVVDVLGAALDIMKAAGATFYDAAYHSVALRHRGTYVTADRRYARRAMSVGRVVVLKDWRATSE